MFVYLCFVCDVRADKYNTRAFPARQLRLHASLKRPSIAGAARRKSQIVYVLHAFAEYI